MEIVLGNGGERVDSLWGGELSVRSRHGLPAALRLLIEALPKKAPASALVGHDQEGVLGLAARALWPETPLVDHHLDAYVAARAARTAARNEVESIDRQVTPDLPGERGDGSQGYELIALLSMKGSDRLLTKEWIEEAHDRLALGGRLLLGCATPEVWRPLLKNLFGKVDLQGHEREGAVLSVRRTKDRLREKERVHSVSMEFRERGLEFATRPGVFLYGRIDTGTRALLADLPSRGDRSVLDLGCGVGVLGICAATRPESGEVVLVDSNARAVALASRNLETNAIPNAEALLRADLEDLPERHFDLVLANPPYFGSGRIAESFANRAMRSLADGGRLLLVAKAVNLHREILDARFESVFVASRDGYGIFEAMGPRDEIIPPKPQRRRR